MNNKICYHVLGLGESAKKFYDKNIHKIQKQTPFDIIIGVNDIERYVPGKYIHYIVALDKLKEKNNELIKGYNEEKTDVFKWVKKANPLLGFVSQLDCYSYKDNFIKIKLATYPEIMCNLSELDSDLFPWSTNSPFVAACLAYKLGAKNIILWGVDFNNHIENQKGREARLQMTLDHYYILYRELKRRNVQMYISSEISALSKFIPVYNFI